MPDRPSLVFDGDCGVCTWSAHVLDRWSRGSLAVVPWQRTDLAGLGLTGETCAEAVQFVDGPLHRSGAAAIACALMHCRFPGPLLGGIIDSRLVAPIAEHAYRLVAENRHRLPGATPACAA